MPDRAADGGDGSPDDWFGLSGKVVVVAGAGGGGIGTGIAALLARAGASVVGLDNRPEALTLLDDALTGTPGPHRSLVVDLRQPSEVDEAVAIATTIGPLHGLVHVAGGMWPQQWATVLGTDLSIFDQVVDLNLRTALTTLRAVGTRLVVGGSGGSMVTIASIVGLSAMPYGVAYSASKAALLAATRTAALELGPEGVRVNAVAVGTVRTPKNANDRAGGLPQETPAERAAIPLGRRGTPGDIAGAVLYLLSDLSTWVTGQTLAVDGGSSTRPSLLDEDNLPVFVQSPETRARLLGDGVVTDLGGMPVALFGVSAGLGPELALGLAERGAAVALLGDVGEASAIERARATLRSRGHTAAMATFDARDGGSVHDALAQASDELGPIRGVVDVDPPGPAATPAPFHSLDKPGWDDRVTSPLRRMLHRFQAVHRALGVGGGRLVVVIPTLSMSGAPGLVPWVTASEGRRAFAKVAARTWGGDGITVNCLGVPALLLANDPPLDQPFDRPGLPAPSLGRLPQPGVEVASTVAGLLGDDLGFVTGATLSVDGGVWMTP